MNALQCGYSLFVSCVFWKKRNDLIFNILLGNLAFSASQRFYLHAPLTTGGLTEIFYSIKL